MFTFKNKPRQYKERKPFEQEWIKDIPLHWNAKRIRFVANVNPTGTKIALDKSDDVSFIPMECVKEYGGLYLENVKPLDEIGSGYTLFIENDVVVAKITPCFENGKGSIAKGLKNKVGFGTTELHVIRVGQALDNSFLFYLTISDVFRKTGESHMYGAGGQKRISDKFIKNFYAPLPPIAEQKSIANFLDQKTKQIDNLIEQKEKLLALLTEKRTAIITQAVTKGLNSGAKTKESGFELIGDIPYGWSIKQLKRVCKIFGRIGFRGYTLADYVPEGEGAVSISPGNIEDNKIVLEKCTYISWNKYHESPEIKVFKDDLILVKTGSTIGKVAHVQSLHAPMTINPQLAILKDVKVNKRFLYYALSSDYFQNELKRSISGGATPALTQENIGVIHLLLPTEMEQVEIAEYLSQIVSQINSATAKIQTSILALKEYKNSLITSAVTGQIDVRKEVVA